MSSDTQPQPETPASPASAETLTIPVSEFEALKSECQEWKERCMRSQAEFDNVRKRLRKEADEAGSRAAARALKPVLNEIDNLARAIEAARPEAFSEFAQGVTMIRENLVAGLIGQGLELVTVEGTFDPAIHEVLAEQDDPTAAKGTILAVHRSGWRLRDQLVRSAQVVVAKGPAAG
jgi:molecular chaperone GrpE